MMRIGVFLTVVMLVLAACASVPQPRLGAGPDAIRPSQFKDLSTATIRGDAAVFAFRPIKGAPAEMIFALEDLLESEAKVRRINIAPVDDPTVTYVVAGFISAVGDQHSTAMVHVWDIFDTNGRRVHRLSGQEPASGSASDPWAGISEGTMADAARNTIDAMAAWVRS